jgi:hypothetical protein
VFHEARREAPPSRAGSIMVHRVLALAAAGLVSLAACSSDDPGDDEHVDRKPSWKPGLVYSSAASTAARGLLDLRGAIHAHSVHSYDACDNEPKSDSGAIDEQCFEDFRRGLCESKHDFVMLSDHRRTFEETEFPEALLYRPDRGDTLVARGGDAVASWAACPEAPPILILAGAEEKLMPVGLERHAAPAAERHELYGATSPEAIAALRAAGAIVLVPHPEAWTVDELAALPIDGLEMYNLHLNAIASAIDLVAMTRMAADTPELLPHPDLALLPIVTEIGDYLTRWGSLLARGQRRVATLGTDCHRNAVPQLLPDGERFDSYRRMLIAFSNHLLVRAEPDGSWDDRQLKDALRSGRLYGAFEYLGYPSGFDYHALEATAPREMGDEVSLAKGVELRVRRPTVARLDPSAKPPEITARILRAREAGWDEVAIAAGDLSFGVSEPGAYRAEIRMRAHHLVPYLSSYAELVEQRDFVWIYSNPIYVVQ